MFVLRLLHLSHQDSGCFKFIPSYLGEQGQAFTLLLAIMVRLGVFLEVHKSQVD